MKILIVGAGMGGLSLAAFLKNSRIEFDIIEKSATLDKQGFSIGLWNNGRNMLKKLGLAEKFDAHATTIKKYRITDNTGRLLREYNLQPFTENFGMGYSQISRHRVHEWLLDIVGRDKVQLGKAFENVDLASYDLIVGADGIHSAVRSVMFQGLFETFDDWRIRYEWVDRSENDRSVVTESIGAGTFVGRFDSEGKTFIVTIAPRKHGVWDGEKPGIASDMSHIKMRKIVTSKSVLIGDAAHGFEPYAGLGASMAMEDAYILAGELMKNDSAKVALARYQKIRRSRVRLAQKLTHRMRLWSTIRSSFIRKFVDACMPFIPEYFFVNSYMKLLREEI